MSSDKIPRAPRHYLNPFLAQVMAALGMIDTMGLGIRMMATRQAERYMPLPDYDLTQPGEVKLTIPGRVVDEAYTQVLMERSNLPLEDILALDRVQKRLPIDRVMRQHLRRAGLIEGRAPDLWVTALAAEATDTKAEYIRDRTQGDTYFTHLVLDYLDQFGRASRQEIHDLLAPLLGALSEQQKKVKVQNVLAKMRTAGTIQSFGPRNKSTWRRV